MTLALSPETEARLQKIVERDGVDPNAILEMLLNNWLEWKESDPGEYTKEDWIDLRSRGIDAAQAAEIRAKFATFAEDWDDPEMDIYDNYDAAKSALDEEREKAEMIEALRECEQILAEGRFRPLSECLEEHRKKYGYPADWSPIADEKDESCLP